MIMKALCLRWLQTPFQIVLLAAIWLLAEMLLFFVPAVVAVVNYQDLLLQEGWRIMVVLLVSTTLVLGTTALVVDRVYRLELKLARRSRRHV
jgi:holin-like protein